jgi:hypothetical protein
MRHCTAWLLTAPSDTPQKGQSGFFALPTEFALRRNARISFKDKEYLQLKSEALKKVTVA